MATNYDVTTTTREQDALRLAAYQAGRIAALRHFICAGGHAKGEHCADYSCREARRLLAEAESEQGEVRG